LEGKVLKGAVLIRDERKQPFIRSVARLRKSGIAGEANDCRGGIGGRGGRGGRRVLGTAPEQKAHPEGQKNDEATCDHVERTDNSDAER